MFKMIKAPFNSNGEIVSEERNVDNTKCFVNCTRNDSQLSISSTMSQKFTSVIVYQRRKQLKNFVSAICSDIPSISPHEHPISVSESATEGVRSPNMNGALNACNVNNNGSSSKLNLEHSDAGECSSSVALNAVLPEISQRDIASLILRTQGLLDEVSIRKSGVSTEKKGLRRKNYCSKSCKVCKRMDSTSNMLICDNCEDAFHISCNPLVKILPVNEWLCGSCLKKKHKILKDQSTSNVGNNSTGTAYELDSASLEFIVRDTQPRESSVRIGSDFQADIPDWHGPVDEECDLTHDLVETDSCNNVYVQDSTSVKPQKLGCIGNWLQCQEIIVEGGHEKICGKWRRAPLYEVQTDKFDCFRCVIWDPVHADCAVPQELATEEVLKQLKYVEMLKPRFAAKKRRLDSSKSNGSQ